MKINVNTDGKNDCDKCLQCENCVSCQNYGNTQPNVKRKPFDIRQLNINSLTVFPTNLCNFRCDYCFIYKYPRKFGKSMNMTLDTSKKMVMWLLSVSTGAQIGIHWFGGEPLVAFDLIKNTTEWAKEYVKGFGKRMKWGMTSNLSLITPEVNEFLKENQYNVLCSIDGLAIDHDKHRVYEGRKPTWKDTNRGFERLLEWKDPSTMTIRWTVGPDTRSSIVDGTKYFINKGIRHIAQEYVYETEWTEKDINELEADFDILTTYLVDEFESTKTYIDVKTIRDGLRGFYSTKRMTDRCGQARGDLGCDVDGNLFSCHRFVDQYDYYIGNIHQGLNPMRVNKLNQWSMANIRSEDGLERCMKCEFKMGCNAGCTAVNFDTTGNLYVPPKAWCDLQLMKFRTATNFVHKLKAKGLLNEWMKNDRSRRMYSNFEYL